MRLKELYIKEHRVLQDLTVNFERSTGTTSGNSYYLDFLVGVNGTGKSTVLRVIGTIFAQLFGQASPKLDIPFRLTYVTDDGTEVTVSNLEDVDEDMNLGQTRWQLSHRINKGDWRKGEKVQQLPDYVVVYTTGDELSWKEALIESELAVIPESTSDAEERDEEVEKDRYILELPGHPSIVEAKGEASTTSKLLFIQYQHLPLVTLCGLLAAQFYCDQGLTREQGKPVNVLDDVLSSVGLHRLEGFSLRIRLAEQASEAQKETIENLRKFAKVIRQGADELFVFNVSDLIYKSGEEKNLLGIYRTLIDLFQHLFALYAHMPHTESPLQEVNMFLSRKASESSSTDLLAFDWLSDGERSFLARMSLFTLFRAPNLLILLDEPEVHFNDVWKREIVYHLDKIMQNCASHALITTHSSISLSDVAKEDILVLRKQNETTSGEVGHYMGINTLGADPSDIMVHVFGARLASGERGVQDIQYRLAQAKNEQDLEQLAKEVAPGYWSYRIELERHRLPKDDVNDSSD